jgi:hypothetical protein
MASITSSQGRKFGYSSKKVILPAQIEALNQSFSPKFNPDIVEDTRFYKQLSPYKGPLPVPEPEIKKVNEFPNLRRIVK